MPWVNHVKSGIFAALSWSGVMLCVLTFQNGSHDIHSDNVKLLTFITLYGIPPFFAAGMVASWVRLEWTTRRALAAIQ